MIEARQIREAAVVLRRDPGKYISRLMTGILLSSVDCELGQVGLTVYSSLKKVDDALDGERFDINDPLGYAQDLSSQIASGHFSRENTKLKDAIAYLDERATPKDNPRADFIASIDSMTFDFNRAKERRTLSREEIEQYYLATFNPVNNLLLIGLGSTLRAGDIPEFALSQGRIYSVRDIEFDWRHGVLNVPSEVLSTANLSPASSVEEVLDSSLVRNHLLTEVVNGQEEVSRLEGLIRAHGEKTTERVFRLMLRPMKKFSRKYTENKA